MTRPNGYDDLSSVVHTVRETLPFWVKVLLPVAMAGLGSLSTCALSTALDNEHRLTTVETNIQGVKESVTEIKEGQNEIQKTIHNVDKSLSALTGALYGRPNPEASPK